MGGNEELRRRTHRLGLKHTELARQLNNEIEHLTGRIGTVSERTVYNLMTGRTQWPHTKIRLALEAVFGCTTEELGFTPPGDHRLPPPPEEPVRRRAFLYSATGAAVALAASNPNHTKIGMPDVVRARALVDQLSAADDQGESADLETRALAQADIIHGLLNTGSTSQRVRSQLYTLAADATTTAAWASIDGRATLRAGQHLDRAVVLAGLSSDPSAALRAWHNISMLATQQGRHADALAATTAARATGITRRDPLYASLCHARAASCHARTNDRQAALRSLGHAEDALGRADLDAVRPGWMCFYDTAELTGLAAIVHLRLGEADLAEYCAHQTLSRLRPEFVRNRQYYTVQLALAQLRQGDPGQACATAASAVQPGGGSPNSARVRSLLRDFQVVLMSEYAGTHEAQEWVDRTTA
ncbi:XRE family transcriptional regulator [Streptomyces sp. NPDC059070]|uniref:XRE family transcriptional regulator n=1 Tax=Streptomyces sp. NPDC059070 TaxID=3346713 RepID=UPI0036B29837